MFNKGFTLIELVVVILILGILAVTALPKFINFQSDANQSIMRTMQGAIESADKLITLKIILNPDNLNSSENEFTLENGQNILVRGKLPDGRWNNTFSHLVNFDETAQVASNTCDDETLKWCVRFRDAGWFSTRGYASLGTGRGCAIFPFGKNIEQDRCSVYFLNQNASARPDTVQPSIIGSDFSEC